MDNELVANVIKTLEDNKLYCGRMLSANKTAKSGHLVLWNGNIIMAGQGKIWFGDIDITADGKKLKMCANQYNTILYVLREKDARFSTENDSLKILVTKAVWNTEQDIPKGVK